MLMIPAISVVNHEANIQPALQTGKKTNGDFFPFNSDNLTAL